MSFAEELRSIPFDTPTYFPTENPSAFMRAVEAYARRDGYDVSQEAFVAVSNKRPRKVVELVRVTKREASQ